SGRPWPGRSTATPRSRSPRSSAWNRPRYGRTSAEPAPDSPPTWTQPEGRTPTMPETTDDGSAELDRWLAARHAALLGDLARTLDLDAGLRDAILPARHTDLLGDLDRVLDVDAGVAAILPALPHQEPRPVP